MTLSVIIVESPAKCKKIEEYLGPGYKCLASFGHLRELKALTSIDINNNYEPTYDIINNSKKKENIDFLRKNILKADEVILATDDDREGEAIAWHICKLFNLPVETTKRIIFHEITETAVQHAIRNPTIVNMNVVYAQQARQILDLIVGFKITPVLWKMISDKSKNSLSAGRCQSPALRIIYDNQEDIKNSPCEKVYNTTGYFTNHCFPFDLNNSFDKEEDVQLFLEKSIDFEHKYNRTDPKKVCKQPPEPLTTSRLQQLASNELHISPKETMKFCQTLYEAGYITYMRTDSKKYCKEFITSVKEFIIKSYEEKYIHSNIDELSERNELTNNHAQEAHEAIRPTNILLKNISENMSPKERKIYNLIWETTLESCMSSAEFFSIHTTISAYNNTKYTRSSEIIDFPGWKIVASNFKKENEKNSKEYHYLMQIKNETTLKYKKITSNIILKNKKQHYTEARLVQLLEEKGIGRPSTFSMLVDKIQEREYVKKSDINGIKLECRDYSLEDDIIGINNNIREFGNEKGKLVIQPLGIIVMDFLTRNFDKLFNYEYTKYMEDNLDKISKGEQIWHLLCKDCHDQIDLLCEKIKGEGKQEFQIDKKHSYIIGKNGPVIKCVDNEIVTFKPVKNDIDIHKLERGEYKIEEIVDISKLNYHLGKYKDEDLILKKGKYGLYAMWGDNKKSLSSLGNRPLENISYENVIELLDKEETSNRDFFRKLGDNASIRTGKFGDYIFYKSKKMSKPLFLKLGGFKGNYKLCDVNIINDWIHDEYNLYP